MSTTYRQLLAGHDLIPSLSATGNCDDNGVVESFFGTLRRECEFAPCASVRALRQTIDDYIDGWYNPHRLHSSLGHQSPLLYEARLRPSARAA